MKDDLQIMIDLETLDLAPSAVVTQLGWATYRLGETEIRASGCYHLAVPVQLKMRRTINWDTIAWWLVQDEASRHVMVKADRNDPYAALEDFRHSIQWSEIKGVWSHGLNFDIPILCSLFQACAVKEPWHYRTPRDTRTMMALSRGVVDKVRATDVKHSAEHDAIAQALTMQDCYRAIFVGTPGQMP